VVEIGGGGNKIECNVLALDRLVRCGQNAERFDAKPPCQIPLRIQGSIRREIFPTDIQACSILSFTHMTVFIGFIVFGGICFTNKDQLDVGIFS